MKGPGKLRQNHGVPGDPEGTRSVLAKHVQPHQVISAAQAFHQLQGASRRPFHHAFLEVRIDGKSEDVLFFLSGLFKEADLPGDEVDGDDAEKNDQAAEDQYQELRVKPQGKHTTFILYQPQGRVNEKRPFHGTLATFAAGRERIIYFLASSRMSSNGMKTIKKIQSPARSGARPKISCRSGV